MATERSRVRADRVSAWAIGVGIGLIAMMLTWLIGNRLAGLAFDAPTGPVVALGAAVGVGVLATSITGFRLDRSVRR
ncbi:MAG: hypothetical protein OEW66_01250 [Actinomycetota bacterium]|nr:hypothetical protein [Actinomycetota bacterium]MDH5312452.1 hypothetical protein [Actinomycetota bacterium]